jgi:hypothetical protein
MSCENFCDDCGDCLDCTGYHSICSKCNDCGWKCGNCDEKENTDSETALKSEIDRLKRYKVECDYKHNDYSELESEITALKEELEEARRVIGFYASESRWDDRIILDDGEMTKLHDECGGRRAREYLNRFK